MVEQEVLSNEEINALLHGVDSGEVTTSHSSTPGTSVHIVSSHGAVDESCEITNYDFISNLSTYEKFPVLDELYQQVAAGMQKVLYSEMHRNIKISAEHIKILSYSEYRARIPLGSFFGLMKVKPLKGLMMVLLTPKLIFSLVEAYFGGDGAAAINTKTARNLSLIERKLGQSFIVKLGNEMQIAWQSTYPLDFELVHTDVHNHPISLALDSDRMLIYTYTIELGPRNSHTFDIAIPYPLLEPVKEIMGAPWQQVSQEKDPLWLSNLQAQLLDVQVQMNSTLTEIMIKLNKLITMQAGDVIPIDLPETVRVKVCGIEYFEAQLGTHEDHLALKILDWTR